MNKKVWTLTKVFLKNSFQSYRGNNVLNNNKKKSAGMKLVYLISFIYLAGVLGFLSYSLIAGLIEVHQETMFIGIFLVGIAAFFIIQSIFSCMNVFYFSKDIESVLPLPLKPAEILMAKFNVVLITEYIMELILGFIPFIIYGILTGASVIYYIAMLVVLIVFPILPLIVSSLLVVCIMSFAKFTKKRESFQMIATLITLVIVFGIQFGINSGEQITTEQMIEQLAKQNSLVEQIQDYFVTVKPSIQAMTATNVGTVVVELAKVIGITALGYIVFVLLGQKLYLRGVVGNLSGNGKGKKKNINVEKAYRENHVGVSYVKKELKILIRNPIFFMQCVLPSVLFPFIFIGIGLFGSGNEGMTEINQMIDVIHSSTTIFVLIGVTQFFTMFSYISITGISRDGLNASFTKYIPISLAKQFKYKAIPNILLNILTDIIVFGMVYILFPQTSILFLLGIFIVLILTHTILSFLNLLMDFKKPKLEWSTEYAVVKQNINLVFPAIFAMIGIVLCVILGIVCSSIHPIITIASLVILLGIILWGMNKYIEKNQVKLFEKIS